MANGTDSGGSDLGRRIIEQRAQAGLTLAETADRAGMSQGYLSYLEASPMPNPTHATLTRLAAALGTDLGSLSGAGLYLPPGQRGAAKNPVLEKLTAEECRARIAPGGVGRFLFIERDRGPVAIPVNFRIDGDDVVFRTASHSALDEGVHGERVSFDVDHLDEAMGEGWSVLLTGTASVISDETELKRAEALDIEPWAGADRTVYVRMKVSQVSGRRIRVTG